jgi:hypothetical protein
MVNKKKNSGGKGRKKKAESEEESYSDDDDDDSATSFTSHLSLGKAGGNSGLKPPSLNTSTVSMTTTGKVPYGCRLKPPSLSTSTVSMTTTGFVPYDHHMHVLTIGRGSPGTGNDGFFQDSLLTSGLKVIIERFFKAGHTIIPIKFAPEQSGYGIDQSQTLLDVYNYVYKNPSHHIIVIATDSTRFGRDLYNIRYFMNYVHSANPNVQFTTIKEFGLYLDQSAQLVEKWGMDRHKSYDDYKKLSEELEQTSEEKMIESAIKERVRELKDNSGELRRLRSHISTALDEGMVATLQHEAVVGVILRSSDFSTDERLRALVGLFEEGTKKVGDVECYRASNYSETDGKLIVKVDMVPVDQSIFVAATKIVLKITTQTKWIIFDNRVNRNRIGKGTIIIEPRGGGNIAADRLSSVDALAEHSAIQHEGGYYVSRTNSLVDVGEEGYVSSPSNDINSGGVSAFMQHTATPMWNEALRRVGLPVSPPASAALSKYNLLGRESGGGSSLFADDI